MEVNTLRPAEAVMVKPVSIGDRHFPSTQAALAECQRILHKYPGAGDGAKHPDSPKGTQTVSDSEDVAFLHHLIAAHKDAEEKIGSGVERFEVRPYKFNTRCFFAVHTDGTAIDFGIPECVKGAAAATG